MDDILHQVTPLNTLSEKARFFSDNTYQPQFSYRIDLDSSLLTQWGQPHPAYEKHAHEVLHSAPFMPNESPVMTEEGIFEYISNFNKNLKLPKPLQIFFSPELSTRCKITETHIYFQTPIRLTEERFKDLMRHELQTHLLRRVNHRTQPWATEVVPELNIRRTEEGLANLHSHLLRVDKIIRKSYISYLATATAQKAGFREVFDLVRGFRLGPELAWTISLRSKRGIRDTSQPGGLTKDLCYFEGTVQVWDWLMQETNSPEDLYLGRLPLSTLAEYRPRANHRLLSYPTFFDNLDDYRHNIKEIGKQNNFASLPIIPYD